MLKNDAKKPAINRIVIGDVGSGKTIVAFVIAGVYLKSLQRGEVVMLAPTEVLAFQHYQKSLEFFRDILQKDLQVNVVFVTSKQYFINGEKVTKTVLKKRLEEIRKQHVMWVGTHALLFFEHARPNLVMVDEQHRFGVKQRQHLATLEEGQAPHFISFTATPIPRTLALTVYKQLKPHFLQTLANRNPITTTINSFEEMESVILPQVARQLSEGKKAYVICPKVEDKDEEDELWSIKKAYEYFDQRFAGSVAYVHGKEKQKKEILEKFKQDDEVRILVSTTVVEVGVDVAMASCILILNAERFGLSALHQIRGRVGRNDFANNYCFLITAKKGGYVPRLQALVQSQDGFVIAQKDLQLRGSGDMIGTMQSGSESEIDELLGLDEELYEKIANLAQSTDMKLLPRLQNYVKKQAEEVWGE